VGDMLLKRKSDGLVIADASTISEWSPWYSLATVNQIPTISGVLYPQPWGVEQEAIDLEIMFAAHYGNAGAYNVLKAAWRRDRTLRFTDFEGVAHDVRPISAFDSSANKRWTEVRTKNIRILSVSLLRLEYAA
jgi:hypothetical protein